MPRSNKSALHRLVTRRVGARDHSYLSRGRLLGEARLISEIGLAGARCAAALRAALDLDFGDPSRLRRALTAEGLVEVVRRQGDARGQARRADRQGPPPTRCL